MKFISALRFVALVVCFLTAGILFSQQLQHEVKVVNIEISTRVFKGDTFIDNLTINDFEVFENGKPQAIEAVYLIKKTDIKREEGKKGAAAPQVTRQFVLFFEMSEYLPEIDKVLNSFFNKVILPGDSLIVITPMKRYHMRSESLAKLPKDTIKAQLQGKLRQDIFMGTSEYRNTIEELYKSFSGDASLEEKMEIYSTFLSRLESLRRVNEKGLIQFADYLKTMPGQKFVYLFYQKENVPQYSPKFLMQQQFQHQDDPFLTPKFMENFDFFNRDVKFDVESVKKAYADSSISIHFLYVTKTPAVKTPVTASRDGAAAFSGSDEITMVERSEDIFSAFNEISQATGGISDSSANAAVAFQRAVNASENYYLIYYKPLDYKADGKFREIKVNVKTGNFRVLHRAGYFAN
jgi:VWFA-related protein